MTVDLRAEVWLEVSGVHLEGVVWDGDAGLVRFVDIPKGRVFHADPATAEAGHADLPAPITAVHPTTRPGTLLVADGDGMALASGGELTERLAAPLAGRPEIRMNDGNVDPAGRYLAGSMAYDSTPGAACLYRLDPDRSLHTLLTGLTVSNGIDWSPDGALCYFIDTPTRRVDVFDYDVTTGALSGRRVFADTSDGPGMPDGMTVDADGGVWVAFWGGSRVVRYAPDGTADLVVRLPVTQVTSCAFGGPGLDQLYITTSTEGLSPGELSEQPAAGALFRAEPGHRGRPSNRFAA
ncbi:SMP-30/gluconolactonase/LRE family protein [Sphaerisporangium rubeum]|uniref:Sugar lactone lactonase YvrE n=1 Tax=Sphaerisporangium rubeum TaxID=321317 RepID=A0A7X0IIN9_9ACTN|nr:SMP-30/gluconolactonase/LRE family protein [Sphaerisporangium rubeum]MBB6475660.1 sugar lactone lactonase YvrE [Sphaerisporangium rubeum]